MFATTLERGNALEHQKLIPAVSFGPISRYKPCICRDDLSGTRSGSLPIHRTSSSAYPAHPTPVGRVAQPDRFVPCDVGLWQVMQANQHNLRFVGPASLGSQRLDAGTLRPS